MKIFGYILATARALILIIALALFIFFFALSFVVWKKTIKRSFTMRRNYAKFALFILNIKIELIGDPPSYDKTAIYVSNHRTYTDPVIITKFLDFFVIAKAEIANMPIINYGAALTGVIYVKREDKDSRTATRTSIIDSINEGKNILVFAEGTVAKTKEILPLKYGTFIAAAKNNIPVIPIALEYKNKSDLWLVPGFLGQHAAQFSKWKTETRISFGQPIQSDDGEALRDLTQEWLAKEVNDIQENWSEAF